VKLGASAITDIKLGTTSITQVLLGDVAVWAPSAPGPQYGVILWSTDHENGQVDWFYPGTVQDGDSVGGGEYNSGTGDSTISTEQARSGTRSLKMAIDTASGSGHGTRNFRWHEFDQYDDLFIEAWLYFPQRLGLNPANDWFNLWQWKTVKWVGSPGGDNYEYNDPLWSLDVHERGGAGSGGNNFLILVDFDAGPVGTNAPVGIDIPIGQWFKLTTRYKRHLTEGIIQVWLDDQLVFDKQNIATIRADEHATHWSVNCYADMTVPTSFAIYLDDVTIALPVDDTPPSAPGSVTATPATSTSVNLTWTAATDNIKVAGYEYRVDGGSWVDAGDTLSVLVGDLDAATEYNFDVRAYDDSGNYGPHASDTATTPSPAVTFTPAANGDDKHAQGATGNVVDFGTVIIGSTDATEYGDDGIFRFPNVTIPQGATIHNAALILTVYDGYGGAQTTIYGDAADNSAQVSNGTDYSTRTLTSASVAWTLPGSPATNRVNGEEDISPNIASIIQEIVNRPGWASGNAISLFVTTPNTWSVRDRVRYQCVGGAGNAIRARLEVSYS